MHIQLLFPNQLFQDCSFLEQDKPVYLIEEYLYFKQYNFHQQKIAFHRATMKAYEKFLIKKGYTVNYIEATDEIADIRVFFTEEGSKIKHITVLDVVDDWLNKRIVNGCNHNDIKLKILDNPAFINNQEDLAHFFKPTKQKFHQTTFYKQERKRLDILMQDKQPEGGKWTFDTENRKKYPKGKTPPAIHFPEVTSFWQEAVIYTRTHFKKNIGELNESPYYPITFQQANDWFQQFLTFRFAEFGVYEDAIVPNELILNHSVLSPLINVGLLDVRTVVEESMAFAKENKIPINSVEGFVRQLIGWREFIRGLYISKGVQERTANFWQFDRRLPKSFYDGTTGIPPIDTTIQKVLKTGYCHHIERLMLLANFMTLCEIHPDAIYQWFMELFIDAYDWVMVPNVYGMATFSDGGLMSTKPYISSSNYVKKMSSYKGGNWQKTWDALFWRFMHKHRSFFASNPRLGMLLRNLDKMSEEQLNDHLQEAERFLSKL